MFYKPCYRHSRCKHEDVCSILQQGDHNSGNHGKPGKVMEFQKWTKMSWKCQGNSKI